MHPSSAAIHDLKGLPQDEEGPAFDEPWQAHAFALAVRLSEAGCFSWAEWTAYLSQEIRAAQETGDPDLGFSYYHHWLSALERLCEAKGLVKSADRKIRQEQWREAYLNTPHGRPVELATKARVP
jgi:nitrile hydratase accessory protein